MALSCICMNVMGSQCHGTKINCSDSGFNVPLSEQDVRAEDVCKAHLSRCHSQHVSMIHRDKNGTGNGCPPCSDGCIDLSDTS